MMFWQTYKNTLKNIFRSPLFWLLFGTLFGFVIYQMYREHFMDYSVLTGEIIADTDPRWVYDRGRYIANTSQIVYILLDIFFPILTVSATYLIASRDFGDGFYEIEKAGGINPVTYYFARIGAIFTMNGIILTILAFLYFHLYTYTRGMVEGMVIDEYIIDSTVRLIRAIVCAGLPCILFYITFTYVCGSILRSGVGSAICGVVHIVAYRICTTNFRMHFPGWVPKYLPPTPNCVERYLYEYDTAAFEDFLMHQGVTFNQTVAAVCITLCFAALFMAVSYLCVRRRTK